MKQITKEELTFVWELVKREISGQMFGHLIRVIRMISINKADIYIYININRIDKRLSHQFDSIRLKKQKKRGQW